MSEQPAWAENEATGRIVVGHMFQEKAIAFGQGGSRTPSGARDWARCLWNADIFFGPLPVLKLTVLLSAGASALVCMLA